MSEERNCYGCTEEEVLAAMDGRNRIDTRRQEELLQKAKERAAWDNFMNIMCGTGIIRKV